MHHRFLTFQGASVLNRVGADLYFTGEMSHHEILRATMTENAVVVLTEHTNCERGYLADVLKGTLEDAFKACQGSFQVLVSEEDQDPIRIITCADYQQ